MGWIVSRLWATSPSLFLLPDWTVQFGLLPQSDICQGKTSVQIQGTKLDFRFLHRNFSQNARKARILSMSGGCSLHGWSVLNNGVKYQIQILWGNPSGSPSLRGHQPTFLLMLRFRNLDTERPIIQFLHQGAKTIWEQNILTNFDNLTLGTLV